MKRIVRLEIDHCLRCPHSGPDINVTRAECKQAGGKMICWDGDSIETRSAYIPDWCPLWVAQGKPMWKPNATADRPAKAGERGVSTKEVRDGRD